MRALRLRWQDLGSHEDLLHQLGQDVEEVRQVQVDVVVLVQLGRVQLEEEESGVNVTQGNRDKECGGTMKQQIDR